MLSISKAKETGRGGEALYRTPLFRELLTLIQAHCTTFSDSPVTLSQSKVLMFFLKKKRKAGNDTLHQ